MEGLQPFMETHLGPKTAMCKKVVIDTMVQVLEEGMGRRGEAVQPLVPVLHRTLADVQERLTFRAQAFIKVCFN